MGSAESISQCVKIIQNACQKQKAVVVVSALSGTTNTLLDLIEKAKKRKSRLVQNGIQELRIRHKKVLNAFAAKENQTEAWATIEPIFKELCQILNGVSLVGDLSPKTTAAILSYGERISSWIMHAALRQANVKSQRESAVKLIRTDSNYLDAHVDFNQSKAKTKKKLIPLLKNNDAVVVTGFIALDKHRNITLLGRGGSDYTASLLGAMLGSSLIEIWTDVDGVMSADPRVIQNTQVWREIDVNVMAEMAYVGAKVLHPKTVSPALKENIPVVIKNTFNPEAPGTKIVHLAQKGLRGVVVKKNQALIQLTDPAILNQIGAINRYSNIFSRHNIAIDVCATSEISVTFSINQKDANEKLYKELRKSAKLEVILDLAKVCVVGSQIGNDSEILAKIFDSLKKYKIHTVSIGASFNNITLMANQSEADEILKILHKKLF